MSFDILRKAKTHKGRKILDAYKGTLKEGPRTCLFLNRKTSEKLKQVTSFLYALKKDFSKKLQKKNDFHPFEETKNLVFLCEKNICPIFTFCNHTKKRPNTITFGRIYDEKLLDMFEF